MNENFAKMSPRQLQAVLRETRRKLGPYVAIQRDDPWRQSDAALARALVTVIEILDIVVAHCPRGGAP